MSTYRKIQKTWDARKTVEGAGVHLKRVFGYEEVPQLDPFLLLDDFSSGNPADYIPGFPWHPHRGIETVTYMVEGVVKHEDSMGNKGVINTGDIQWMSAGSGIIHQEMPQVYAGGMKGFQLWVNIPRAQKMMQPRYQEVQKKTVPEIVSGGAKIKIISGELEHTKGPVEDLMADPSYFDIQLGRNAAFELPVPQGYTVFAYIFEGSGKFTPDDAHLVTPGYIAVWGDGDMIRVQAGEHGVRFLLIWGKPLGEPIAWYGPIVMNTKKEIIEAFDEYQKGTFVKSEPVG